MWQKRQTLLKLCVSLLCLACMLSSCKEEKTEATGETAFAHVDISEETPEEPKEKPDEEGDTEEKAADVICVYICGQVVNPGVYEMHKGDRVTHVIQAAGGMTEQACGTYLNQAQHLEDGQMIYVPSEEEAGDLAEGGVQSPLAGMGQVSAGVDDGKVNLNKAGKEELMTLSGIGESRAEAIITYRQENGGFKDIEEIKKIEGIKDGIFQRIKDQITV